MERQLLLEWKNKLEPKLRSIAGVNSIRMGKTGLVVELEATTPQVQDKIMEVLEREGADHIPYMTKVVGRVVRVA